MRIDLGRATRRAPCFVPLNVIHVNLEIGTDIDRSRETFPHWPVSRALVEQQKRDLASALCREFDMRPCGMSLCVLPSLQFEYLSWHGAEHAVLTRTLTLRPGAFLSNDRRRSLASTVNVGIRRILKWLRRGFRFR